MIRLQSPAKINLYLKVLFPRPDGYHELRTVFQTISLVDTLEMDTRPDKKICLECDHPEVPVDAGNLCARAARALQQETGCRLGADLRLMKEIPVQGGLGGGSSNAAVTLLGLNRLWSLDLPPWRLAAIGATLGADVPFFLRGGTALGVGRGDEIIPLADLPVRHLLVVCPRLSVSTAWAYSRLNFLLTKKGVSTTILTLYRGLFDGEVFLHQGENDFENAVFPEFPLLRDVKSALLDAGAATAMLSGSGAALFGLFDTEIACREAEGALRQAGIPGRIVRARFVTGREYRDSLPFSL